MGSSKESFQNSKESYGYLCHIKSSASGWKTMFYGYKQSLNLAMMCRTYVVVEGAVVTESRKTAVGEPRQADSEAISVLWEAMATLRQVLGEEELEALRDKMTQYLPYSAGVHGLIEVILKCQLQEILDAKVYIPDAFQLSSLALVTPSCSNSQTFRV
ncbi:uncharacterized protein [Penaeus vannamei]|uniref:uncharacterized protein n=1 Tax=Penaeus vannamei TaxID=6689 RepID=UPI00387F7320